ncbi:1,4-alpha-glucan branching protein GlgB [Paenibacillus beijingensis]|uniref:1,4-alpha-glucan branching enzyme GlgB n=1 Tax=Paenibacillus beijingensis TaxID=1126833 RepID=A0A0D5NSY0_9BACL|nr:1,4-alpha-glucan branching protein GlgB [Paenibacillus beijingensis]AJY78023.1 1,4-alpha-glucan branching protein [Paenibacillus beijingensis]
MVTETPSGLSMRDLYLFNQGDLHHSYRTLGAHIRREGKRKGVRFAVWAPNAAEVRVAGDFNGWQGSSHVMEAAGSTGVWELFIPGIGEGTLYKYEMITRDGHKLLKADPYAFASELRPGRASVVTDLSGYKWKDEAWEEAKRSNPPYRQPMLIYEVHLGSWKLKGKELFYTYDELSTDLVDYVHKLGYTHIELLPLGEHPFDKSWGYQMTGYFSPTSRYGSPKGLMRFVDRCHKRGIGVIMDWVPGHFCKDDHGLRLFDGTPLYEGSDPKRAEKPLWGTNAFDFGRTEVQSFLISNALYWMDVYHIDGIRVDAVASMTDLRFDKPPELQTTNRYGGHENLEAVAFLKKLNETIFHYYPHALMIAEDSSAWPGVTSPTYMGGLGFNFKWNMGWMNDMLRYMEMDPSERPNYHNLITFSIMYAYSENFVLPLSHDEVVHGKRSLLNKMPGEYSEKFAQLRLFYAFWISHPGKKLLFMGGEFGQFDEWKDTEPLDWMVLGYESHSFMKEYTKKLNSLYLKQSSLWADDFRPEGFQWIDVNNWQQSIISFIRRDTDTGRFTVMIGNFSKTDYPEYRVGVPEKGKYKLLLNSDDAKYGGGSSTIPTGYSSKPVPMHGFDHSITLHLPPLSFLILAFEPRGKQ